MLSFFIYKEEVVEKRNQQKTDNVRFEMNVNKLDSITQILNLEYLKLTTQEEKFNLHHNDNLDKLYNITRRLTQLVDEVKIQSLAEQKFFVQNFDSLSNVTENLTALALKAEMESYPLVPIVFELKIHFKYKKFPFEKSAEGVRERTNWQEWFTFFSKLDSLDYGNSDFPKFVNEETVKDEFLRNFKLTISFKKDSIMCFTYPILEGVEIKARYGILYAGRNRYDDYTVKVINSNKDHELVFHVRYKINSLSKFYNACNYQSITDFINSELHIDYEIKNPRLNDMFLEGRVCKDSEKIEFVTTRRRLRGKEFIEARNSILKDTNYHLKTPVKKIFQKTVIQKINKTLQTKNIIEKFDLDVDKIYLDSVINITYGKNLSINKKLFKIKNSSDLFDEFTWHCNGRYLFK